MSQTLSETANLLTYRIERLSADSRWAHRASGVKGALLRCLQNYDLAPSPAAAAKLQSLVTDGFDLLAKAAREIPDPDRRR